MRRLAAIVFSGWLLVVLSACTSDDPTDGVQFFSLVFTDLTAAEPLRVDTPMTVVIRDQATWDAFWQAHVPLAGPAPVVNFVEDMLVGVFWGIQGSGCSNYVNAIEEVRLRFNGINSTGVIEVDIGPLPTTVCPTVVYPLQVIVLDTTITPVQFVGMVPN